MRRRLLLILVLGLMLAQATLVASFAQCPLCASAGSEDDCPSPCESCLCCSMARMIEPTEVGVRDLAPVGAVLSPPIPPRRSADPQDIFHVPKPPLA
jgi:hypothetical protein